MFVSTESLGEIQKLHFFNDKGLPAMGSKSERLVSQFLELSVNPTVGNSAYKYFFDGQEKSICNR